MFGDTTVRLRCSRVGSSVISRRQFFGRAAVGAVGVAAVPFMPWEALASLFKKSVPLVMDIDIARFGNEWTYIDLREIYSTDRLCQWAIRGHDLIQTVKYIEACIKEQQPQSITVDRSGIGAGVIDQLRYRGYEITELYNGRFFNRS